MDFAYDQGTVWVVDPDRLMARVGKSENIAERFAAAASEDRPELGDILRELGIFPADVAAYRLAAAGFPGSGIWSCLKTPDRRPYIPGSSLKGALRGTITRKRVQEDSSLREELSRSALNESRRLPPWKNERQSRTLRETSRLVDRAFAPGKPTEPQHYDFFRVFGFGDATTGNPEALHLAEVHVLSLGKRGLQEKTVGADQRPMRLNVEVLPERTVLGGRVTLNRHLLAAAGPAEPLRFSNFARFVEEWLAICNAESRRLGEAERDFFSRSGQAELAGWYARLLKRLDTIGANQCLLRVGWGSGFDGTAALNLLDPAIRPEVRAKVPLGKLDTEKQPVEPFPKSRKVIWERGRPIAPLGWILVTLGARSASAERKGLPQPAKAEPEISRRTPRHPEPRRSEPEMKPRDAARLEALRRSLERKPDSAKQADKATKASEKAKREQERILRKLRGEDP
jgi:CRISPR-associated protein Csm5